MKRIICISLFISTLFSCQENKVANTLNLVHQQEVKISDLMSDCTFIPLETTNDNLILDVSILRMWNNRIYVLDSFSQSKGLYVFDIDGKYLGKIGSQGVGPGEYIMPLSLVVDEADNRLIVKDMAQNKLLFYDASTFNCVDEYNLTFSADCFDYIGEGKLIWYAGDGWQNPGLNNYIYVTDMKGNILNSYLERRSFPQRGMYNVTTYFHKYANNIYFHHPYANQYYVYDAKNEVIEPNFVLDCNELVIPSETYVIENSEQIVEQLAKDGYAQYVDVLENSNKQLFYIGSKENRYIGVWDKHLNTGFYVDVNNIIDDMGLMKFNRPKTVYQNRFVNVIYREGIENIPESSLLSTVLKDKELDGNPIVVLYD